MNKIVIANLKMNFNRQEINQYVKDLNVIKEKVVVCPPSIYLTNFIQSGYITGAQNCYYLDKGSFTGEISPLQLKSIGTKYVIIGHSERRTHFHETDESVNKKVKASIENGLVPIICIGETKREKEEGLTLNIIKKQLLDCLNNILEEKMDTIIVAYEPIWAIGTGLIPTNQDIEEVIKYIKELTPYNIKVLYGGSVNSSNIKQLCLIKEVDGFLVGGASLKPSELIEIINNC